MDTLDSVSRISYSSQAGLLERIELVEIVQGRDKYSLSLEPSPFYKLLFPESLVDLGTLAYYFARKGTAPDTPIPYFQPSLEFIAQWLQAWKQHRWFYYY